jgi:amidase
MGEATELWRLSARETVELLKAKKVSPLELVDVALARIEQVNPKVNAIPTLCAERARAHARAIMGAGAPGGEPIWLAGLPLVIKDLNDVAGVRTTYGSPIFSDHVPARSGIEVETLERRGGIVLGKSNTPEFGAGANTFNEVFGVTRNPWNTALTCAGSSGGAAVALATGMAWLADGSDLGGSLRTPASFCSVVGLRPSPGRVAHGPTTTPFGTLSVEGPMARNVRDLALMLDAMAGYHIEDPLTYSSPSLPYSQSVQGRPQLRRVGYSADLGGIMPVDPEVRAITEAAAQRFSQLGATVAEGCPDLGSAEKIFTILRAELFVANRAPLLEKYRDKLKPEVIWNIEHGLKLTAGDIGWAERERGELYRRTVKFFESYDLLLCPTAIVPPFPVETRYLAELQGKKFTSYIDWVIPTYALTLTACPAISVPCGFTRAGLPVGLQMLGRPRGEAALLAAAAQFEDMMDLARLVPIDPRPAA